jgi:hypothetical protein
VIWAKFATRLRLAVRINVYDAFVDTTLPPSVQLRNLYPFAGVAVTVTVLPQGRLVPLGSAVPPAAGLAARKSAHGGTVVKMATKLRLAVTENLYDAFVDIVLPFTVQLTNAKPGLGVAVTVAELFAAYVPPPLVVPPLAGLLLVAIV